jgi:triacylglycerol esterase/lipase EstA (alpha/beta hydrolase family)
MFPLASLRSLSPRRRLLAAGLALLLAAVTAVSLLVTVLRPGAGPAPAPRSRIVPVLLVPGYGGTPSSLAALAAELRGAGRQVTVVGLPDDGTGEIGASAAVLGATVAKTMAATGADQVDLVGYSAGGLVVRAFLALPGQAAHARHVVLLGTPNHGALLAGLASLLGGRVCSGACPELAPDSAFLQQLNGPRAVPPGPDVTSIWTADDRIVTPPSSAVLDGARNIRLQDICAGARIDHGGLVRDPLPLALVSRALAGSLPARLGPPDCATLRAAA